jgi:very-short-patch-repair endonuclease
MKCSICNKDFNKTGLVSHEKTCKRIHILKNEIKNKYINDFISIVKLSKEYNIGKDTIINIVGKENIRTLSESLIIAHKIYPEKFKHTEETKNRLRELRLKYMKENPGETSWRLGNEMSYPEKLMYNKFIELEWDKKYLIVREKSVFPYFIDFAFENELVAVEIDGSQHLLEKSVISDEKKNDLLMNLGWSVIRITDKEIKTNIQNAINIIEKVLNNANRSEKYNVGILEYRRSDYQKVERKILNNKKQLTEKEILGHLKERKVERPSYEQLKKEIEETSYCAVGRKYGVSDNAIRKWIKYYEKN